MSNDPSLREFADRLIAQERQVSDERFARYRQDLDVKLMHAARHERRLRIVLLSLLVLVAIGVTVLAMLAVWQPNQYPLPPFLDDLPAGVSAAIVAIGVAIPLCLVVLSTLYFLHYKRRLQSMEQEQVMALLVELHRQVEEVRKRLPPQVQ